MYALAISCCSHCVQSTLSQNSIIQNLLKPGHGITLMLSHLAQGGRVQDVEPDRDTSQLHCHEPLDLDRGPLYAVAPVQALVVSHGCPHSGGEPPLIS